MAERLPTALNAWRDVTRANRVIVYTGLKRMLEVAGRRGTPTDCKAIAAAIDVLALAADGGVIPPEHHAEGRQ